MYSGIMYNVMSLILYVHVSSAGSQLRNSSEDDHILTDRVRDIW